MDTLGRVEWVAGLGDPAAGGAVFADRQEGGVFGAGGDREGTAGAEAAAFGPGAGIGRLTLDGDQAAVLSLGVNAGGGVQERPGVGVARVGQQFFGGAFLYHFASIHHQHARADIGDDTEVVADQDDGGTEIGVELAQQVEDLRLDGDVERGGGFVGDQQGGFVGEAHGEHDTLAHAAAELVGVGIDGALRRADAHAAQQGDGADAGGGGGEAAMGGHRLDELAGDAQDRVQRRHGVLEDHGDFAAADGTDAVFVQRREVLAAEADGAADNTGGIVEQADDRFRADTFARTGLTDDAQGFAGVQVEADAIDRAHRAGVGQEPGAQITHLKDGSVTGWCLSGYGHVGPASRAVRRQRN